MTAPRMGTTVEDAIALVEAQTIGYVQAFDVALIVALSEQVSDDGRGAAYSDPAIQALAERFDEVVAEVAEHFGLT
ncbi:hypothetical protein I5H06_gp02 [Mycobacterium phage SirPhilip]|uniref:Uncharacterized protein n=1 Tax=Mycobacterium phage SirPhilip TaxID=2015824 RepID=A0A222ZLC9_9CAUD|nr:hypothetical protein I5H06_gp02 [Mycobacterium phage SirPhilip]ASR85205.1 hypothetical protein SEA_SIRPHILIP_2 [Mycobacterium phage SirPhilip]